MRRPWPALGRSAKKKSCFTDDENIKDGAIHSSSTDCTSDMIGDSQQPSTGSGSFIPAKRDHSQCPGFLKLHFTLSSFERAHKEQLYSKPPTGIWTQLPHFASPHHTYWYLISYCTIPSSFAVFLKSTRERQLSRPRHRREENINGCPKDLSSSGYSNSGGFLHTVMFHTRQGKFWASVELDQSLRTDRSPRSWVAERIIARRQCNWHTSVLPTNCTNKSVTKAPFWAGISQSV